MTRRRAFCGLLLASAMLACFAGWLWTTSGPRVTRARFKQVKEGMSRDEVIRIVGGPSGDYRNGSISTEAIIMSVEQAKSYECWFCDDGLVLVRFDDSGRAVEVDLDVGITQPPTLTERIRRWLGL
jgi:hypothetical protein